MTERDVVAALVAGGVAIIPTDTVYGLAARPGTEGVVAIFALKGRPADKPLPVCGASLDDLAAVATFDNSALALAAEHWPGPLTLVLERAPGFDADLGGSGSTVAVRVPDRPATLEILAATGPLAVTSANRSGEPAAVDAVSASTTFPGIPVLDDGPGGGTASTVVSLVDGVEVLREGPVSL